MRVKQVDRNNPAWQKDFECRECGAVITVERADLFTNHLWDFGGERNEVQCRCCICGRSITIDRDSEAWVGLPSAEDWKKANGPAPDYPFPHKQDSRPQ